MKKAMFLLALLPLMASAQTTTGKAYPDLKKTRVHYRKIVTHWGETITDGKHYHAVQRDDNPGVLQFSKNDPPGSHPVVFADTADAANIGISTINDPEITAIGNSEVLKGDLLIINNKDQVGTLTGHIKLIRKGKEHEVGTVAVIDLSGDTYRVLCMK